MLLWIDNDANSFYELLLL